MPDGLTPQKMESNKILARDMLSILTRAVNPKSGEKAVYLTDALFAIDATAAALSAIIDNAVEEAFYNRRMGN